MSTSLSKSRYSGFPALHLMQDHSCEEKHAAGAGEKAPQYRNTHFSEMPHYYSPRSPLQRPQFTGSECQTGFLETGFSQLVSHKCELPPTSRGRAYFPPFSGPLSHTASDCKGQVLPAKSSGRTGSWQQLKTILIEILLLQNCIRSLRSCKHTDPRMRSQYWDKLFRRILCFNELRPTEYRIIRFAPSFLPALPLRNSFFTQKITLLKAILLRYFHSIHAKFQSNLGLRFKHNKTKMQHLLFFTGN